MLAFPPDFTFIVQLVSFFLLLVLLNKLLFTPFADLLEARRQRTEGLRGEAVRDQSEAESLARTIEQSLQEARARAGQEAESIRQAAREREAELFNQAKRDAAARLLDLRTAIGNEREQAKQSLRSEAKALATSMVEAVLRPATLR
jgi:F-type H+-transporting ATPase subunit b